MSDDSDATKVGAAAGGSTVLGIGAVATGSSAATMTTTLATIGGYVGGGMAAGIAVVAAAPIAIGGIAYGLHRLFKK